MFTDLTHSEPEHIQLVEVVGRIVGTNTLSLIRLLDQALANGREQVVLDLSGVEYINSAGLRELVRLFKHIKQAGGMLYLTNPTERVGTMLELVGLDTVLPISSDPSLSLARLSNGNTLNYNRQVCYCS